ncbi:DUF4249 domain-containing protein [Saccharicrinis fermentans]|uniref:DUF4249 domain-containing protein n=1 Tax=Saccharicrinis fermentans DSM 9555 = JCM 21142 TaxID=869213 RepID=W7Y455_9BACT|nr:DUF4249 domain-containing protein [Saccharicrinis fermentans]GAF05645.1 hypothetical protein JCM21142_104390 [Saccharicrinis fermentans DSM 9555 = JCM 21142]
MKKYNHIAIHLTLFFHILLLTGCEKELEYQITNQEPQIVMYAFPMPDSILQLHASYSTQILSTNDYDEIQDLEYTVSVNGIEQINDQYPEGAEWVNIPEIRSKTNDTIQITYLLKDGTSISGSTTIPLPVSILSLDTAQTSYVNDEGDNENMLRCTLELNDPNTEDNYYQIRVDHIEDITSTPQVSNTIDYIKEDKVFLIRDDESVLLTDVDFLGTFTDHLFNGNNNKINFLIPEEYLKQNTQFIIYLYTLTPEYYQFLRTSLEEEAFRDYPIFEPVNIYTNIENGIGVVAGLAVDTCTIVIN